VECDCQKLSPYQRLALSWNEVMNIRGELPPPLFDATTQVLADMDAILSRLEKPNPNEPIPLYTSICKHPRSYDESPGRTPDVPVRVDKAPRTRAL
jgi:hypothetical protein